MNKTDLLLRMMEQPNRYTDDEWQAILADDECRELYTLMAKTQSAFDAARADETITDDMIESEWQKLSEKVKVKSDKFATASDGRQDSTAAANFSLFIFHSSLQKIAAALAALLMLSCITYATIHIARHVGHGTTRTNTESVSIRANPMQNKPVTETDSITVSPKLYDNVPLEQILTELSAYYGITVSYRDEGARRLRLFYQWKSEYTLAKVIEMLNNFETLRLQLDGDTLFVSSTIDAQP